MLATLWTVAWAYLGRVDGTGWFFFTSLESPTKEWWQKEEEYEGKSRDDEKEGYHNHAKENADDANQG